MPVKVLRPTAIGAYNSFTLAAGASKVIAVDTGDPVVHDGDTTYLSATVDSALTQSFVITTVTGVSTINSFTQKMRAYRGNIDPLSGESSGNVRAWTRKSGVDSASQIIAGAEVAASYTDYSISATRPGGGPFTGADFDGVNLEFVYNNVGDGVYDPANFDPNNHYTSMWGILDYESGGADFVDLIRGVVGRLAGLRGCAMPALARLIGRATDTWLRPDEHAEAWRAYRAYTFPRIYVLGGKR